MFDEIYKGIKKFFKGPVISTSNTSIPHGLSRFISKCTGVEYSGKCYGVKIEDCYLITHDDKEKEDTDSVYMGSCFMYGEKIKYISIPLYSGVKDAKLNEALAYIAMVSIYTVSAVVEPIERECSIFKDTDINAYAQTDIDLAPAVIFCNVAKDLCRELCTPDLLMQAYKSAKFAEIDNSKLFGHRFINFFDPRIISFIETISESIDDYNEELNNTSNELNTFFMGSQTYQNVSFVFKYLDCSEIINMYYDYGIKLKEEAYASRK